MRKGDGTDGQRAKVMGNFATESASEERLLQTWMQFVAASVTMRACTGLEMTSSVRLSSVC